LWRTGWDAAAPSEPILRRASLSDLRSLGGEVAIPTFLPVVLRQREFRRPSPARTIGREDGDHDGLTNHQQQVVSTNPSEVDSDNDGKSDADEDKDHDGLSNEFEFDGSHTSPIDADSDNDSLKDGDEDDDADGVSNEQEQHDGTDPEDADSDHDGTADGDEGSSPAPTATTGALSFHIG
jgi:hypothetical protein